MKIKNIQINKKLLTSLIALGLTGCALKNPKSDCKIKEYHLHRYEKDGVVRYLDDESLDYDGYQWTDNVLYESKDNKDIRDMEKYSGLISIRDNDSYLQEIKGSDYMEYRYFYDSQSISQDPFAVQEFDTIYYDWTRDENHSNLTGDVRMCHPMYRVFKLEDLRVVPGPLVDDVDSMIDEYPYVKEDDLIEIVDLLTGRVLTDEVEQDDYLEKHVGK